MMNFYFCLYVVHGSLKGVVIVRGLSLGINYLGCCKSYDHYPPNPHTKLVSILT